MSWCHFDLAEDNREGAFLEDAVLEVRLEMRVG